MNLNISSKKRKLEDLATSAENGDQKSTNTKKTKKRKRKTKVKKAKVSPIDPNVLKQKLQSLNKIVIGLDMSLSNPGICVIHPMTKTLTLFFFRNRQLEHNGITKVNDKRSCFYGWYVEFICLETMPEEKCKELGSFDRSNRYLSRLMTILSLLGTNIESDTFKVVGIEHYSYNSRMSSSYSILMELGGCLRMCLSSNFHSIVEIPPTSIKKMFSGNGKADKDIMYQSYLNKFYLPDICKFIGMENKTYKHVPHPVEDMVDSLAVAVSTMFSTAPPTST